MALAGELLAELQWLTDQEISDQLTGSELRPRVAGKVADVFLYLLRFADVCGIDPVAETHAKINRNERRFPANGPEATGQ